MGQQHGAIRGVGPVVLGRIASYYRYFASLRAFHPGWLGLFVNPFWFTRRALFEQMGKAARQSSGGRLLDIGCGSRPYRSLFKVDSYVGLEVGKRGGHFKGAPHVAYDGEALPFGEGVVDHVLLTEVLEHVFEPKLLLREIFRVLKPGGVLYLTVPFVWDAHEVPFDFGRYTCFGLRHLLEREGFQVVYEERTGSYVTTLAQLCSAYLENVSREWPIGFKAALYATVNGPVMLLGLVLEKFLPRSTDLYLDNVVWAHKPCP